MAVSKLAFVFALIVLATSSAAHAEIYKTVDKDGNVTYSDRPSDDAKPVQVAPTNRMVETAPPTRAAEPTTTPAPVYESAAITAPTNGATVTDPVGNVTVQYALQPQARPGDTVRLMMDNVPTGMAVAGGIMVQGATRGEHALQIQVVDGEGQILAESGVVRIQVVRPGPGGSRAGSPRPTPH